MSLTGKNVLITGAAGNLGQAVAAAFQAQGANLILLDLNEGLLRAAYGDGNDAKRLLAVDLLDPAELAQAVEACGRIDVLCNLAGGFAMGEPVHQQSAETWQRMMSLNAGTVLNTAQAVVPGMLRNGGGKIVNVAAMGGLSGGATMAAYSAAKSAVIRITESMAAELREQNINVNCVLPSIIDTPQNRADMADADFSRWVAPAALADVIVFLASDGARAIHGAALPVVGLS